MNLLKMMATLGLDATEYEKGLNGAETKAKSIGGKIGGAFGKIAKAGATAVGTATTAVGVLVKKSIDGYADLEQLRGGVETLFGPAAKKVMADADAAYKTAGMSANEYMETSIQSAAALINSLGGDQQKASQMMNMSITDMADNVNKMGTNMQSVQDAYRGFSRGNFTMLDNLALGFAGTKDGMQQLLDKAHELSGVNYDINKYSDIVQAIHVVQEEMGITGTTAKEAAETISGSVASMKSAWQNLVAGIADPEADISKLVKNVVDSAATVAKNLVPAIGKAIVGASEALNTIIPELIKGLPAFFSQVVVPLVSASANAVRLVFKGLIEMLPGLLEEFSGALKDSLPSLLDKIDEYVPAFIKKIVDLIVNLSEWIRDNIDTIVEVGSEIILAIVQGLVDAMPYISDAAYKIIANLVIALIKAAPAIARAGMIISIKIAEGIIKATLYPYKAVANIIRNLGNKFRGSNWQSIGKHIVMGIASGIANFAFFPLKAMSNLASRLYEKAKSAFQINSPSKLFRDKIGASIDEGIAVGILDKIPVVTQAMDDLNGRLITTSVEPDIVGDYGADEAFDTETAMEVLKTTTPTVTPVTQADTGRDVTVVLQLDKTQLARTVFRLNNEEKQRVGVNLVGGLA